MVAKTVADLVNLRGLDAGKLVIDDHLSLSLMHNDNGHIPDYELKANLEVMLRDSHAVQRIIRTASGMTVVLTNGQEFMVSVF